MAIIRPAELKLKQKKKVEQAMSSEFQNFMSTNSSLLELKLSLQLEQVLP